MNTGGKTTGARSRAERIYALMVCAYPPGFRRRHGPEMVRLFRDLLRPEARGGAVRSAARPLLRAGLDVLATAPGEWARSSLAWWRRVPAPGELQGSPLADFAGDLRYAARSLARRPGPSAAAGLTLGLCMGANTAIFSVADRAFLRPLPFPEPERLVALEETRPREGRGGQPAAPGTFLDWAKAASFADLTAWQDGTGVATLRDGHEVEVVETVKVTPAFFRTLGMAPALGRVFDPATEPGAAFDVTDRFAGGDRVLVLSHAFWTRRFASDPGVLGRSLELDGAPWKVIGVMPADLALPRPTTEVFIPFDLRASFAAFPEGPPRDLRFLNVIGRLRRGVSPEAAQGEIQAIAAATAESNPRTNAGWSVEVSALRDPLVAGADKPILLLGGAAGLVLLLGAANVASLQLARALARRREMAVRLSLGASPHRLVRQLLTESLLLGVCGGAGGLAVAAVAHRVAAALAPPGLAWLEGLRVDPRLIAFAAALTLVTTVAFGLAPAWSAGRVEAAGSLSERGRSATSGTRTRRLRALLVVGETAGALVLLAGAGLLGQSLLRVLAVDPGFDPRGLVSLRVSLDHGTYEVGPASRAFHRELLRRLQDLPGVSGAGGVTALPLHPVGTDFSRPYGLEGETAPGPESERADIRMATPGYFEAMRTTLLRGRSLTESDHEQAPRVIVVNETLARRAFGEADPVGRRLVFDYLGGAYPYEIVGLVKDMRFASLKAEARPEAFIPHAQNPYLDLTVVVRAEGDAAAIVERVRREIAAVDPRQPAHAVATMEDLLRRSTAPDRFAATLVSALAGLALVLAATGLHGLLATLVAQRTPELGLRQALGATPREVVSLVLAECLRLVAGGLALGAPVALALAPWVKDLLYEVNARDASAWAGAAGLLLVVALIASGAPARAAARIDPMIALRSE